MFHLRGWGGRSRGLVPTWGELLLDGEGEETIELVPKTRDGVWVCKSSNAPNEYVNYEDKPLFDK